VAFWESGAVLAGLFVLSMLGLASLCRARIAAVERLGIPDCILAGMLGLLVGPGGLGWVSIDSGVLESAVYHGLALVFIAVGLQEAPAGRKGGGGRSMAFAIPFMAVMQGLLGLLMVLLLTAVLGAALHPGFGLLLPLGFNQGPGQALSMGSAWEQSGLVNGSQVGLIMAAMGFFWAIVAGVPLIALGRKLGWLEDPGRSGTAPDSQVSAQSDTLPDTGPGGLEVLTLHVVFIGVVYLATFGVVSALASGLAAKPQLAAMIWGFHFLVGVGLAMALRIFWRRVARGGGLPLDTGLLGRIAGLTVDFVTCAAISAVQVGVLRDNFVPIFVITTLGGGATLLFSIWLARRAFPEAPFEHCLVLFGISTGTLPMGLALLRKVDPQFKGPAPASAVLGAVGALVFSIPLLLVVMPIPVGQWPDGFPGAVWLCVGILAVYLGVIVLAWKKLGPLELQRPFSQLWPAPELEPAEGVHE